MDYKVVIRKDLPEGKEMPKGAEDSIPAALIAAEEAANQVLTDGLKLHIVEAD